MRMTIEFSMDNAAFDDLGRADEISRILKRIEQRIQDGEDGGGIVDYNGNRVGEWEISE